MPRTLNYYVHSLEWAPKILFGLIIWDDLSNERISEILQQWKVLHYPFNIDQYNYFGGHLFTYLHQFYFFSFLSFTQFPVNDKKLVSFLLKTAWYFIHLLVISLRLWVIKTRLMLLRLFLYIDLLIRYSLFFFFSYQCFLHFILGSHHRRLPPLLTLR